MTTTTQEFSAEYAGCYVDGARGIYVGEIVQDLAAGFGWAGECLGAEEEWYQLATIEAEEFLNSLPSPDDYSWSWNDGDFGFYHHCDDDYRTTVCEVC